MVIKAVTRWLISKTINIVSLVGPLSWPSVPHSSGYLCSFVRVTRWAFWCCGRTGGSDLGAEWSETARDTLQDVRLLTARCFFWCHFLEDRTTVCYFHYPNSAVTMSGKQFYSFGIKNVLMALPRLLPKVMRLRLFLAVCVNARLHSASYNVSWSGSVDSGCSL